jgi:hypothetical protein
MSTKYKSKDRVPNHVKGPDIIKREFDMRAQPEKSGHV